MDVPYFVPPVSSLSLTITQWRNACRPGFIHKEIHVELHDFPQALPSQASFVWLVTGDRVLEFKRNHHPSRTVRGNASGPKCRQKDKGAFPGCYNDSRINFSLFGVQSFGDGLQIWIRIKIVHGVAIAIIFLIRKAIFWEQVRQFETPTMDPEKLTYVLVAMCVFYPQ